MTTRKSASRLHLPAGPTTTSEVPRFTDQSASFLWVVQVGTRALGVGDVPGGAACVEPYLIDGLVYYFDTPDASGSTAVSLLKGVNAGAATTVSGSALTVTAANQADGSTTDAARTVTFGSPVAVAAGERLYPNITSRGTTPGNGFKVYVRARRTM
jgi:hypothetical protein